MCIGFANSVLKNSNFSAQAHLELHGQDNPGMIFSAVPLTKRKQATTEASTDPDFSALSVTKRG